MTKATLAGLAAGLLAFWLGGASLAQEVCLPAPRLLTIMPMGGQAGTTVEVAITGEEIDEASDLLFSTPKITAKPKLDAQGKPEPNKFLVTVAADAPLGVTTPA
jgi:hypothetical protein